MECKVCKQQRELRYGVCFDCVEAEAIIHEGLDMYEKGLNGEEKAAITPMEKLKLLVQKGWHKGPVKP